MDAYAEYDTESEMLPVGGAPEGGDAPTISGTVHSLISHLTTYLLIDLPICSLCACVCVCVFG